VTKNAAILVVFVACAGSGCSTTGDDSSATAGDGGGAAVGDATVAGDAGAPAVVTAAEKAACVADPTSCLTGTATTSRFTATPARVQAKLYRVFPHGTEPIEDQLVDDAGTWAFHGPDGGLDPWAHYYVDVEADFDSVEVAVAAIKGPLSVPSTGSAIAVDVPPAQLSVLESRTPGGPMQLRWALAHVYDPSSGAEIKNGNAAVTIAIGGAQVNIPWSDVDGGGVGGYYTTFSPPAAAQTSYGMTVSVPGRAPLSYQLAAVEPAFDGAIVSPDGDASVPANRPLTVAWSPEPEADYEVLQIFQSSGFATAFVSPQAVSPDQDQETVDAGLEAGSYLVNVSYSKTNCAVTADGCVQANTVAAVDITAN